jgi:predicted nucleic-acid-binding protein
MIGLDTNVLVRYIAQDDPKQSPLANALIQTLSSEAPGFVTQVALVELVWVMQSCYQTTKPELTAILETLLRTRELLVENTEAALKALQVFSTSNGDFSDCLIAQCAQMAGCTHTVSFDKNAVKVAGMRLLGGAGRAG